MSDEQMANLVVSDNVSSLGRVAGRKLAKHNDRVKAIGAATREAQNEICEVAVHGEYSLGKGLEVVSRLRRAYDDGLATPEKKEAAKKRDALFAELMLRVEIEGCSQILEELMEMRKHLDDESFKDKLLDLSEW